MFDQYFHIFPWSTIDSSAVGIDVGCGSGRWTLIVSTRVAHLHCIDASAVALDCARRLLSHQNNVSFHHASVAAIPIAPETMDFAYSLGVLHHVPDTRRAIDDCVALLKPGAPLLLYLYYALDNRPWWFRSIWKISDLMRRLICRLPARPKSFTTDAIAVAIYWPLSRLSRIAEACGVRSDTIPLAYYRNSSLLTLRTDARDRFGTPLERRFTLKQIKSMMQDAGLENIFHSNVAPYWCVLGWKRL